jgi:hypothetical protein
MGDIEIQIRRSTKATDECNKKEITVQSPVPSPAITYQNEGDQEKKNPTEEKPNPNPSHWDYSVTHGKIY